VIWRRLDQILAGEDRSALYRGMPAADRQAVREILLDTKPEFRRWVDARRAAIYLQPALNGPNK
jgi:hypothetical protein